MLVSREQKYGAREADERLIPRSQALSKFAWAVSLFHPKDLKKKTRYESGL